MNHLNRIKIYIFGLICLLSLPSGLLAKPAPVTLDPQNTIIVHYIYSDNVWYPAGELQKWLRKIYQIQSGFEIVNERSLKDDVQQKFIIALGPTRWGGYRSANELGTYGFAIHRKENVVTIVGAEPRQGSKPNDLNGIVLGSTYFLENFCGVRMYMPDDKFVGTLPN